MHACVGLTTYLITILLFGWIYFIINYQWFIRSDVSLYGEK